MGGLPVSGPAVCGAHWRVPAAVAFEHVLAECGYGGGDAAIGAHGPAHRGGGLGVLGGLRDGFVCNNSAALLLLRGVICGTGHARCVVIRGSLGCALGGYPACDEGRLSCASYACVLRVWSCVVMGCSLGWVRGIWRVGV